jgi:uncharacterized protein (TIGR03663 family)
MKLGTKSRLVFTFVMILLAIGAFAFRQPQLGNRPMHGDEAVHAFKFRDLWEKGVYKYDPNEYHGPTIYYAALPSVWLHGRHSFADATEADFRLPIVLFGAAMVLLLLPLTDALGRRATLWAGLLTAISPAFVFYSRYYIQEVPLAFFTLGMLACGWRYARTRRAGWLAACGACAGLMIASKETAVFAFVAAGLGLALTALWSRRVDSHPLDLRPLWNRKHAALALAVALLVAGLFLSGFLTNLRGPLDYPRAYLPWLNRAGGATLHKHPWNYYLRMLIWWHVDGGGVWNESLIVGLALVGMIAALRPQQQAEAESSRNFARFLTFYTLLLTLIYSLIPYKTPWCLLSFLDGLILLAGIGAAALLDLTPGRPAKAILTLLLLAACVPLARLSYRTSYDPKAFTDPRNPYVYAQPVPDQENLAQSLKDLAKSSPQGEKMVIQVISVDNYYWPLPWYLRRFPNIGYWNAVPTGADAQQLTAASVVLASPEFDDALQKQLNDTHLMHGFFGLRSNVFLEEWIRMDLWQKHVEARKKNTKAED